METLELEIFYWSKDSVKYENIISQLLTEGWERVIEDIPYHDNKGKIFKWEAIFVRKLVADYCSLTGFGYA